MTTISRGCGCVLRRLDRATPPRGAAPRRDASRPSRARAPRGAASAVGGAFVRAAASRHSSKLSERPRRAIEGEHRDFIRGRRRRAASSSSFAPRLVPQLFAPHARARVHEDARCACPLPRRRRAGIGALAETAAQSRARAAPSTRQRSSSSQRFSSRLRLVTRGGVGCRNISVLNGVTSRVVRRMR